MPRRFLKGMCSVTAVRLDSSSPRDRQPPKLLVSRLMCPTRSRPLRAHPLRNKASRSSQHLGNTSVCAGQPWCGAPRRNRTGDPILTMDRGRTAVLTGVFAGRSAPWMPQLWAQFWHLHAQRLDRHRWCRQCPTQTRRGGGITCASGLRLLQHLGGGEDRCLDQRREVQRVAGPCVD
jgi:hypothetical protein